jgi:septum formation protein
MKSNSKIILASASPRRKALLKEAGFQFEIKVKQVDEDFPSQLKRAEVALYLSAKKAEAYNEEVENGFIVITADTIVCVDDEILNKPADATEAFSMLQQLSGRAHDVITAVCIRANNKFDNFYVTTKVTFREITDNEINFYIQNFQPFDKAGAYGIQEWIGLVAITKIEGSYNNVVGLPVAEVYSRLIQL